MHITICRIGNTCKLDYEPTEANAAQAETVKSILVPYFFLLPLNTTVNLNEFSNLIKRYYCHPKCIADANMLEKIAGA